MRSPARRRLAPTLAAALLSACSDLPTIPAAPHSPAYGEHASAVVQLRLDTLELALASPVFVTAAPGDGRRLFIVEKGGRIRVRAAGRLRGTPFLSLRGQVSTGSEQGLLGLAFHPDYAANGRFFVNYTDLDGHTRVVEYARGATPNDADEASARLLLLVEQPASNHNGGMMAFGPDGYLYIAFGDGGGGHRANAQRMDTPLGKILRIDVDGAHPYEVPPDNPFVGVDSVLPEIWHSGLRNPWRFSFDRANGRMFVADVGQNTYEEVNVVRDGRRGLNFGWPVMEGPACFEPAVCESDGLRLPVHWYTHAEGCSITGGYVYRGGAMPELRGSYFFADFCSGVVQSFRLQQGVVTDLRDWSAELGIPGLVTSFGEDNAGELYLTTIQGGLFRIAPRP